MRSTRWSVALCAVFDPRGESSLTVSLGGAHQVGKNGLPELQELSVRHKHGEQATTERRQELGSWGGAGGTKSGQLALPEQWWDAMVRGHEWRPGASAALGSILFQQT